MKHKLDKLKNEGEAPQWMTEEAYQTLSNGYLTKTEDTPNSRARKICQSVASRLGMPEMEDKFYSYYERRWLGFSSPIWANSGTTRGLPISCYGIHVDDSIYSIFDKNLEMAMMTKTGGGVGVYLGDIRGKGKDINNNGASEGVIPWCKIFDSSIVAVNQGGTRKGADALYLPIEHPDIKDFLRIRRQIGDVNRQCLNSNHGICISDDFMNKLEAGDAEAKELWKEVLITRFETGEPYIFYTGNVNKNPGEVYKKNKHLFPKQREHDVLFSNICTEITQYTDVDHSFVCCLSSVNLSLWDEWKDTDFVYNMTYFLDGVMQEFIDRAPEYKGLERALASAVKGRALGIGGMGWHTLLQKKNLSFESLQAKLLNTQIWKYIDDESKRASQDLAKKFGECEWATGSGMRNTLRMAIAPTVSNSTIMASMDEDLSPSVEPIAANAFTQKSAKGVFIRKNKSLERLLESKGLNNTDIWKTIVENEGSVQHLDFLTKEEKDIFLTAREINQFIIITQAADRQKYIDQSQSINLFFPINATPKYMSDTAKEAWKQGLKTLYYCRTSAVIKGDMASRGYERKVEECVWCE
jgi:ribonucleoside-diphosphate reductase alpha chain